MVSRRSCSPEYSGPFIASFEDWLRFPASLALWLWSAEIDVAILVGLVTQQYAVGESFGGSLVCTAGDVARCSLTGERLSRGVKTKALRAPVERTPVAEDRWPESLRRSRKSGGYQHRHHNDTHSKDQRRTPRLAIYLCHRDPRRSLSCETLPRPGALVNVTFVLHASGRHVDEAPRIVEKPLEGVKQ